MIQSKRSFQRSPCLSLRGRSGTRLSQVIDNFVVAISVVLMWGNAGAYGAPLQTETLERFSAPLGSQNYYKFNDIRDVISQWQPNQHLYVKGDLGLSRSQLAELESWLHKRGHWTVILIRNSASERYTNEDGRVETGMDAVELSLSDLMEVGSFRGQVNSVTGQQDGAVFVLFLDERRFSYRASEAQSRRGLGQDRWIGKLDRPAYRAMRGGGRIIDAVKDTVKSINAPLKSAIAQEQKIAAQRALQRKQELDAISAKISQVEAKLARIESYGKKVRDNKPAAIADLANPELGGIETELAGLKEAISVADVDVGQVKKAVSKINDASDDWINLYNEYARFDGSHSQLQQRRSELASEAGDLRPAIEPSLKRVDLMLVDAREAYTIADSKFQKHLNAATYELENASGELTTQLSARKRSEARQSLIRRTAMAVVGFLSTLLAGALLWLNRRRGPAKTRAVARLKTRQQEVEKVMEGMSDLLKRADIVVGDRAAIERKGYQGKTKELSEKTLDDIDDILVMSNSVEKVIEGAKEKIEPKSLWWRFFNHFSAKSYHQGFDMLENQPIEFGENDGIAIVRDEEDGLIEPVSRVDADGRQQKTIALSFKELFKIFRKRSERISETIDRVENGWTQIVSTNTELQSAIDGASANEQLAREATEQDSLLNVPQLFESLLHAAQADQDTSEEIGKHDPISAIAGPATDGLRKATNAGHLSRELVAVRETLIPSIRTDAVKLNDRHRQVEWVDAALDDFTDRAQTLANDALAVDVTEGIVAWRASFDKFSRAVRRSVELHDQSTGEVHEAIIDATETVALARVKIAQTLHQSPEDVLAEPSYKANNTLSIANQHNHAAQAALDRGDPPAAELSVAEAFQWVAEANDIANTSQQVLEELPRDVKNLYRDLDQLKHTLESSAELVSSLENRFTDAALMIEGIKIDRQIESSNNSNVSMVDQMVMLTANELFQTAKNQQQQARRDNEEAEVLYQQARLLQASGNHQHACELLQNAKELLQVLADHGQKLDQQVTDNVAGLEGLQARFKDLETTLCRHHVTRRTQEVAKTLHESFATLHRSMAIVAARRDPFAEAREVDNIDAQFEQFHDLLRSDQAVHDEAGRSINSLVQLIASAQKSARRSQTDQIPDSPQTGAALQELEQADRIAGELKTRMSTPHQDWEQIDYQADETLARATQSLAGLVRELDRAQSAAAAIARAASEYRIAMQWSGGYGIRANPRSVRQTLDQARAALSRGDYQGASSIAHQSISLIANAIAIAENEVRRRQASERRERELRRRRRNRSVGGGSIMIPSGFPDFGVSSSRSSSSRSTPSTPSTRSPSRRKSRQSSSGRGGLSRSGW